MGETESNIQNSNVQDETQEKKNTDLMGGQTVDVNNAMAQASQEFSPLNTDKAEEPSSYDYDQVLRVLNANAPETDAEKARRERKEKRAKLFAAIGDGIGALSNIYFASQGAPAVNTSENSMSKNVQNRIDMLRKEREGKEQAYLTYYLRMKQMQKQERNERLTDAYRKGSLELRQRELEERRERRALDRWKAEIQEKKNNDTFDIKQEDLKIKRDLANGRITKMEADARSGWLRAQAAMKNADANMTRADKYKSGDDNGEYTTVTTTSYDDLGRKSGETTKRVKNPQKPKTTSNAKKEAY